jgi:N6-adenosine-specific RNA methylase IME4
MFDVICIDPPYVFKDSLRQSDTKRSAQDQYDTMTMQDIKNLKINDLAAKDAVIALWVPSSMLQDGLELLKAWGFTYKQTWIWVKTKKDPLETLSKKIINAIDDKKTTTEIKQIISDFNLNDSLGFGLGHLGRNTHEVVLLGTRGKVYKKLKNKSQRTVLFYKNVRHSQKPEELQDRLEKMFPDCKLLEVFGRRSRPNWTVLGNQSPQTFGEDITVSINNLLNPISKDQIDENIVTELEL